MADLVTYNFTQTTPETSWTINHNLGTLFVNIDVVVDHGVVEKILPGNIEIIDNNNVKVFFSVPRYGYARVVGSV